MGNSLTDPYGPKCPSDSPFVAKARFLQSWYRVNKLSQKDYGFGPEECSHSKYGNILVNGEHTGSNFLLPEIFEYARHRTKFLKNGETLKEYRLFNNMLSSQPMCFNLFYPLKSLFERDAVKASNILRACFPALEIQLALSLDIEYLPYPISEYLNDRTAFDAMLIYKSATGERNILAIETKYVESLGLNPSSQAGRKLQEILVNNCNMFNARGKKINSEEGFGQLGRNFLLAEKFREQNRLDKAFAVVISPEENVSSIGEIKNFHSLMHPTFYHHLFATTLEEIVKQIRNSAPKSLTPWIDQFEKRYLGFDESYSLFKEYSKK